VVRSGILSQTSLLERTTAFRWRVFVLLLLAAVFGVAASFPIVFSLYADQIAKAPLPMPVLVAVGLAQNTIILAIMVGVGLSLTAKLGLPGAPLIANDSLGEGRGERFRATLKPATMTGIGVGVAVWLILHLLLEKELPQLPFGKAALIPIWKRLLLCFYGGLTEEIMTRIFLFSLLLWLIGKVWRSRGAAPGRTVLWVANGLLAVIFGLGHLGSVALLMPITFKIVVGAVLLNGIASVAFTSLYLRRGLEAAMLAHFVSDVVLWVIGPSFMRS